MAANLTFQSSTYTDAEILIAFEKIAKELGQDPKSSGVNVTLMPDYGSQAYQLAVIQDQPFAKFAKQHKGASWEAVSINLMPSHLTISLNRNRDRGLDNIYIRYQRDPSNPVEVSRALAAIQRQFVPLNRAAEMEQALGPELSEFYKRREEGLSRLETLTRKLVEDTDAYRLRLDAELADHKKALAESFEQKEQALEKQHQERASELQAREQALQKQRKDLDDRSARHARREQSRALQQKIADRSDKFTLTRDTQNKRLPIHLIFVVLLLVTGLLIIDSLFSSKTATEGASFWFELGRLPLSVVGFALTAIFYIRWNDHWFRQHADQEFRLQQLALDVDRAGYTTEMLLEWQENKAGEMPAVLVDRLTTGLFIDQTKAAAVRHPSEDITAALLKAASSVRLDLPGIGEVNLAGRQIRNLDKNRSKKQNE